ncbi:hypothetical protein BH24ACT20_BH24ACT20_16810 [soil metagenome]
MRKTILLLAVVAMTLVMASGVALAAQMKCSARGDCVGTPRDDRMIGTAKLDTIRGKNGNDAIYGRASADRLYGGFGRDRLYGNGGNDELHGGPAPDKIFGGPGTDTVKGDAGSDRINVAGDGQTDSVDCGIGNDTAIVDDDDLGGANVIDYFRVTSCENVIVR